MNSQSLKQILSWFIFISSALLFWGCFEGAPHSNPLDPRSNNFENAGAITGFVTGFYPPFEGIGSVEVRLSPGGLVTSTDAAGRFDFFDIEPGRYTVSAERPGFGSVSDTINVLLNEQTPVSLRMNGLPVIASADFKTFHLSRWWPPPQDQFWLDIAVVASDPDGAGDVETVFVEIPIFNLVDTLQFDRGRFITRLREEEIGLSVEAISGHDIQVIVRDQVGAESVYPGQRISRIISETPTANTPSGLSTVSANPPVFSWTVEGISYPFNYQIDISLVNENIPTLVQTIPNIPSDSLSITGPASLPTGQYFWTISIIDEFGNQSRSKEAGFIVP